MADTSNNVRWFVVHTYSGYENKVASNIMTIVENRQMHDQIIEVRIPMETVKERKDGKEKEAERKLLPGYVMVKVACVYKTRDDGDSQELSIPDEAWYVIRNTRGVTGFVGPEGKPTPLSAEEVVAQNLETKSEQTRRKVNFGIGDMVRVISGTYALDDGDIKGSVLSIDYEKETVTVNLRMFNRDTPTEMRIDEVEAVKE